MTDSDTPSVDEHPLEGGGPFDALLHPEGYLLVSEAELAEALDNAWGPDDLFVDDVDAWRSFAHRVFAALAKQQEDRER